MPIQYVNGLETYHITNVLLLAVRSIAFNCPICKNLGPGLFAGTLKNKGYLMALKVPLIHKGSKNVFFCKEWLEEPFVKWKFHEC